MRGIHKMEMTATVETTEDWIMESGLSHEEKSVVKTLLLPDVEIELAIPDTIEPEQLWNNFDTACKVYKNSKNLLSKIKPIIGRMLLVMQEKPESYKSKGFETYDDFLKRGFCPMVGMGRSEAYQATRFAKKWPHLTLKDFEDITYTKLDLISKVTDSTDPKAGTWIEAARTKTLDELRDYMHVGGVVEIEDSTPAAINIPATVGVKRQ